MASQRLKDPLLQVFLSYANENKDIAGNVKRCFEYYGVSAFLAHEDIEFGEEWTREIFSALDLTQVLVVILTDEAKRSSYVNQEIGYAMSRGILILPFKIDVDPFGFTSRIQALKPSYSYNIETRQNEIDFDASVEKMVETIRHKNGLSALLRKGLIASFATSRSFKETQCKMTILKKLPDLADAEKQAVLGAALHNDQVYKEWRTRKYLKELISKEPGLLNRHDRASLLAKIDE